MVLKAMGNAISKAVTVAEILKHRVAKLHMVTRISSIETVDVYDPLEEGLDRIETKRKIPSISIQLSLDELDKDDPGYQSPIPAEQVTEGSPSYHDSREFRKARGHSRRSGGNGGRGGEAKSAAEIEETVEAEEKDEQQTLNEDEQQTLNEDEQQTLNEDEQQTLNEDEQQTLNEDEATRNTATTRGKRGKGRGRRPSGNNGRRGKKAGGRLPAEEGDDNAVASSTAEQQLESDMSSSVSTSRKSGRGKKGERTPSNGGDIKQIGEMEDDNEAREVGQGNGRGARGRHFGRGRSRGRGRGRGRGGRGESIQRDGSGGSLAMSSSDAAGE